MVLFLGQKVKVTFTILLSTQAPVFWKVDNTIQWINLDMVDTARYVLSTLIDQIAIYLLDSVICHSDKWIQNQLFDDN